MNDFPLIENIYNFLLIEHNFQIILQEKEWIFFSICTLFFVYFGLKTLKYLHKHMKIYIEMNQKVSKRIKFWRLIKVDWDRKMW